MHHPNGVMHQLVHSSHELMMHDPMGSCIISSCIIMSTCISWFMGYPMNPGYGVDGQSHEPQSLGSLIPGIGANPGTQYPIVTMDSQTGVNVI